MRLHIPLLAAAVLIPALAVAQPAGAPTRKAGWWETTIAMNVPIAMTQTMQICTDPETEKTHGPFANDMQQRGDCTPEAVSPAPGGGWAYSVTCKVGQMTLATSGVAKGDFDSGYHVDSVVRMSPAPMPMMAEAHMTMDAKYLGPCPAGRVPGDMVMANGKVFNVKPKPKP